jgi:hypothetical protein
LQAEVVDDTGVRASNAWELWIVPTPKPPSGSIRFHASCSEPIRSLFGAEAPTEDEPSGLVTIAQSMDHELLAALRSGAKVLMLPNDEPNSFPLQSHWFLRGGPIVHGSAAWNALHPMLCQLQHFDLASRVVPNLQWLSELTPLVMLWDNHDIQEVRTHGLVFATRVEGGLLVVCALELTGEGNAAGVYLAERLVSSLARNDAPDSLFDAGKVASVSSATIQEMEGKLNGRTLSLSDRTWRFRVDRENLGLDLGWHRADHPLNDAWGEIRVGSHWESQGYPDLDGWAWYCTDVAIPEDWPSDRAYLWIDGGDDYYEVYVNGSKVGAGGDIALRKTAFEERATFPILRLDGERSVRIAIRVNDWQGAGGLFRPIQWSSVPRSQKPPILK